MLLMGKYRLYINIYFKSWFHFSDQISCLQEAFGHMPKLQ